jgi:hypothetical protein
MMKSASLISAALLVFGLSAGAMAADSGPGSDAPKAAHAHKHKSAHRSSHKTSHRSAHKAAHSRKTASTAR